MIQCLQYTLTISHNLQLDHQLDHQLDPQLDTQGGEGANRHQDVGPWHHKRHVIKRQVTDPYMLMYLLFIIIIINIATFRHRYRPRHDFWSEVMLVVMVLCWLL